MGPSIFVRQAQEPSPPPRSRLKTLSAFLNPFSSTAQSSQQTFTVPANGRNVTPSAPIPYLPPKTDISLTDLGHIALGGSPFRVYMKDGSSTTHDGLPSTGLKSGITTPSSIDQSDAVAGLPSSHYPLAALNREEKPVWREMPTLASAIHIADANSSGSVSTSSVVEPSKPLPKARSKGTLPRSASSTSSIFEAYKNRKTLRRSSSRASTKPTNESENEATNPQQQPRRKMNRRLSFDNIRFALSGSQSRRKDLGESGKVDQRWSMVDKSDAPSEHSNTPDPASLAKQNRMALPPMRGLRNKFSVGPKSGGGLMVNARADVAARRRIHDWENLSKQAGDDASADGCSMGSAAGRGVLRRMEDVAHPLSEAPPPPPKRAPTPPFRDLRPTNPDNRRTSMMAQPASSPHPLSPNNLISKTEQTPGNNLASFLFPSQSQNTLLFSPAVDDKSFVDPSRSPFPFGISTDDLTSLPALPIPPPREPLPKPPVAQVERTINRQQSLSEIKDAFGRMRDLSGLEISSSAGSLPSSQEASETQEHKAVQKASENTTASSKLDMSTLDQGLKAVVSESMREVELGTPIRVMATRTVRPPNANTPKKAVSSQSSHPALESAPSIITAITPSRSVDEMQVEDELDYDVDPESDTEEGVLSRAQSGRSWHTAKEDELPLALPRLMPRSKSRSTHDIASLASARDLVDQTEKTQGEGWWSVERAKGLQRRASNIDSLRKRFDHDDDKRLKLLEKLAKSSTLPFRPRFPDSTEFDATSSPVAQEAGSGRETPVRRGSAIESIRRPMSSMEVRRGSDVPKTVHVGRIRNDSGSLLNEWRPASVQPRIRPTYHGPRPSLVAGSTWSRDSRSSLAVDDTPTRPSGRRGHFATSRVSPDIARRASCLTKRTDEDEETVSSTSPIEKTSHKESGEGVADMIQKLERLKKKHALELDAILGALSGAKVEVKTLNEEVNALKKELGETVTEREVLKEKVKSLESRLDDMELSKRHQQVNIATRGRSVSVTSTLLPDLQVPNESLVMDASPLEPFAGALSPEDRTRRSEPRSINFRVRARLHHTEQNEILDASMMSGCTSLEDGEDSDEEEWTLKLRKNDEVHLDDL